MKIKNKLYCRWSKKNNDIICYYPAGTCTSTDACFVLSDILNKEKCEELKRRGYDLNTLKLEISPQIANNKFISQRNIE